MMKMANQMYKYHLILLIAVLVTQSVMAQASAMTQASTATQASTIVLATFDQEAPRLTVSELVMRSIYKKLDIEMQLDRHPGNRVLSLANSGKVDGVLLRAAVIENLAKNLIKIPTPIAHIRYTAFTKRKNTFEVNGWDSLKPYKVGILRGIKLNEERSKHLNREIITTYPSLFKMLYLERLDVAVFTELDGLYALKKLNLHNDIVNLSPPIEITPSFHFLHKKHSQLIKRISSLMHQMHTSGELQQLINQSEIKVIESLP